MRAMTSECHWCLAPIRSLACLSVLQQLHTGGGICEQLCGLKGFLPERHNPGQLIHQNQDKVLKIMPVQKQTRAGQRTRFKMFVAIVDYNGHIGLGVKCSKEVATAIHGAIILAKLSIVPVHRGYWGNKISKPHTIPCKATGRHGSVLVRLIPTPRGTGILSVPVPKKLLMMAGIDDCYTLARGCTATLGNYTKDTFHAVSKTYSYLILDLWKETVFIKSS
uniref:Small ribosomal subunit protein uS5 n=1 Tax=Pongo abelii TaxID=9601 RepID=A0A8I5T8V9_PONAB